MKSIRNKEYGNNNAGIYYLYIGNAVKQTKTLNLNRVNLTGKKTYKLTHRQRGLVVKEYASGNYSTRELGKRWGLNHSSITSLVRHNSTTFNQYKKEFRRELEGYMTVLAKKTAKHAIKNYDKLTPYQAVTASAIMFDKLFAQPVQVNIDNRTLKITYPRWGKNRRGKTNT